MRERFLLAGAMCTIILAGLFLSGILAVPEATAAPDLPPLPVADPALAPSYDIGCDFSNPDPLVWTEVVHVDPTECTYWPDQGQTTCGAMCDYGTVMVPSGLSYTMKTCAPACTCVASCGECCSVANTGWSVSVSDDEPVVLWGAGWTPGNGGCGDGSKVTNPLCQQCNSPAFTVPGDGEDVELTLKRRRVPGFWYHRPHVGYSLFVLTTTIGVNLYYPLTYSDTLDVTQGYTEGVHSGIDFSVSEGRPVFAVTGGTVSATGYDETLGYYIEIDHGMIGADTYDSYYYHLSAINVQAGMTITQSCQIAWSGNTGTSTGPHLHLGIKKNGSWVDPAPLLLFYPNACRSDCGGLTNPEFFDVLTGWETHNVSWSSGSYPDRGIVNFLSWGSIVQTVVLPEGENRSIFIRARAWNASEITVLYGNIIVGRHDLPGDGQWHVYGTPVAGTGTAKEIKVINLSLPETVFTLDWVCVGIIGQESWEDQPPTLPSSDCHLENHSFDDLGQHWGYSGDVEFYIETMPGPPEEEGGLARMEPGSKITQTVVLTAPIKFVGVTGVCETAGGNLCIMEVHLNAYTMTKGSPAIAWDEMYLTFPPDQPISGTVVFELLNIGSYAIQVQEVCIVLEGEQIPPGWAGVDCFAECSYLFPSENPWWAPAWIEWGLCVIACLIATLRRVLDNIFNLLDSVYYTLFYVRYDLENLLLWLIAFLGSLPQRFADALLPLINLLLWLVDSLPAILSCIQLFQDMLNAMLWLATGLPQWIANQEIFQDALNRLLLLSGTIDAFIVWLPYAASWGLAWGWSLLIEVATVLLCWIIANFLQGFYDTWSISAYLIGLGWQFLELQWQRVQMLIDLALRIVDLLNNMIAAVIDALQAGTSADFGLPDQAETDHPLYPIWQGFDLLNQTVFTTPISILGILLCGALGLRLVLWTLKQFQDILPG